MPGGGSSALRESSGIAEQQHRTASGAEAVECGCEARENVSPRRLVKLHGKGNPGKYAKQAAAKSINVRAAAGQRTSWRNGSPWPTEGGPSPPAQRRRGPVPKDIPRSSHSPPHCCFPVSEAAIFCRAKANLQDYGVSRPPGYISRVTSQYSACNVSAQGEGVDLILSGCEWHHTGRPGVAVIPVLVAHEGQVIIIGSGIGKVPQQRIQGRLCRMKVQHLRSQL